MTELFDILYQFKSTGAEKVKADMDSLSTSTERGEQATSRFGNIADIAAGILTSRFAIALGDALLKTAELAGQFETATNAFNVLTKGVDDNILSLETLREATMGTVSDIGLLKAANTALAMGLPTDDLTELFHAATVLGNAMGRTALDSVNDLAVGIGRQSRLILDNLGIIVSTDEAYNKYAETLGKTSNQLTDTERKLAWQAEAMTKVSEKAAELEGTTSQISIAFQRAEASLANWQVTVGKIPAAVVAGWMLIIEDATNAYTEATQNAIVAANSYSITLRESGDDAVSWGGSIQDGTELATNAISDYTIATEDATITEAEMRRQAEETKQTLLEAAEARSMAWEALVPTLTDVRVKTESWEQAERDLADIIRYVTGATSELGSETVDLTWETRDAEYAYNALNDELAAIQGEIRKTTIELAGLEEQQNDLKWVLSELTLEEMKLRDAYLDGRITKEEYEKQSARLESQTRDLRIEEYELRLEAERVKDRLDDQKTAASQLEDKMSLLVDTNTALREAANAMKEAVDKLTSALETMGETAGTSKGDLDDLVTAYDEYEKRMSQTPYTGYLPSYVPQEPSTTETNTPTGTTTPTTSTPTSNIVYHFVCPYCGYETTGTDKTAAQNAMWTHIANAHPGYAKSSTSYTTTEKAAKGYEGIVTRPTTILAGEAGPENISIQPKNIPDMITESKGKRDRQPVNITLTIDGRVIASYLQELELDDMRSFGIQT